LKPASRSQSIRRLPDDAILGFGVVALAGVGV